MRVLFKSYERGYILLRRDETKDIYSLGNSKYLMTIATDRIACFDCVFPTPIPEKGIMVTQLSNFWFRRTESIISNHVVNTDPKELDWYYEDDWCYDEIRGRAIIIKITEQLPVEVNVRGYGITSAFEEDENTFNISKVRLFGRNTHAKKLIEPIYTPLINVDKGNHYKAISFRKSTDILGSSLSKRIKEVSLKLYQYAELYARAHGIIIAETHISFGLADGELVVNNDLFTPDTSVLWQLDQYKPKIFEPSFEMQPIHEYIMMINWNEKLHPPHLPQEVVKKTVKRFQKINSQII